MLWKLFIEYISQAKFFVFNLFSYLAYLVSKIVIQTFGRLYIGQMWAMDAMEVTPGVPDTHDAPHKTGAVRMAARLILVQKNHFRNYHKPLDFWLL